MLNFFWNKAKSVWTDRRMGRKDRKKERGLEDDGQYLARFPNSQNLPRMLFVLVNET